MDRDSGTAWIERDANGRFMFVRKRTKLSSTRSMLADAFGTSNNPFGRSRSRSRPRSYSHSRAESKHYLKALAPVRNPNLLALPAPPPNTNTTPAMNMNNTPENARAVIHDTGQYSQPPMLNDPNQQPPYPQYPSYAHSYPAYYLAPNPAPPSFQEPYPPLPLGARLLSPPRPPTSDELKYKCNICGKFRSPRFHYKHPIPPGQLPAQTVCRRCRQTGTDSEDTSDEKTRLRRLRRSRSVVSISEPIDTRVIIDEDGRTIRRRPSQVAFVSHSHSRSRQRGRLRRRSFSSSGSLDLDKLDLLEQDRRRRVRSQSIGRVVERVRYIHESPPRRVSAPRETIYIDDNRDWRGRRASRHEDDYYTEYDSEAEYIPRRRIISRAPSVTRITRQQYSEPVVREHVRFSTRDYFDGGNSVYEEPTVVERPARPPPTLPSDLHVLRVSEDEALRIRERLASSDEYELVADRPILNSHHHNKDWQEEDSRRSRRERRRRRRSRSRMSSHGETDYGKSKYAPKFSGGEPRNRDSCYSDYVEAPRILPRVRAPTPPPAVRRRSARHSIASRQPDEEIEDRRASHHEAVDRRGRPVMVSSRPRSRSRTRSGSRWDAPFGGRLPPVVNEASDIQERLQGPPATEDYDWYDSHGQRVRVREI